MIGADDIHFQLQDDEIGGGAVMDDESEEAQDQQDLEIYQ